VSVSEVPTGGRISESLKQFHLELSREIGVRCRHFRVRRVGIEFDATERRWRDEGPVAPHQLDTVRKYGWPE
jgi:hypothetical protein